MRFANRKEAGQLLAKELSAYANSSNVVVLALPRGGVPVAYEVALALNAPLDVFMVRKLGVPSYDELAMGAISTGGVRVLNESLIDYLRISNEVIESVSERERHELDRRESLYRDKRPPLDVRGHTVIIVDDGMATGATMRAAVIALRQQKPEKIVVAVPLCARETCASFGDEIDTACVCARTPEPFQGVGRWYRNFEQISDEEVRRLLARADQSHRDHQTKRVA